MFKNYLILITSITTGLLLTSNVQAQIAGDNTLPTNTQIETNNNINTITGGTQRGENLFHSFSSFNLNPDDTAFFDNNVDINNILGRITDSNPSSIDGLIRANGNANLFLINPNGIIFGENAALDIGGTFTATTANAITFEDGIFHATDGNDSILSVSIPLGAQLGDNSKNIAVFGRGNNLYFSDFAETIHDDRILGLSNNKNINLIGNNININGGNLTSQETINLVAGKSGTVTNISEDPILGTTTPGNINLTNTASVSVSGEQSGTINAHAQDITIEDGSAILSQSWGQGENGDINLFAKGDIRLVGESFDNPFPSYVSTDVLSTGSSKGGNITIEAENLSLLFGSQINAATFGISDGGIVNVKVNDTVSTTSGGQYTNSAILADSAGQGNADSLNINADNIVLELGGQIGSTAASTGTGANVNINARQIDVVGREEFGPDAIFPSEIISNTTAEGNAGNLNIEAETINISDGGVISAETFGFGGDAGNITVKASEINALETRTNEFRLDTGIKSGSGFGFNNIIDGSSGKSGNIDIVADSINLGDGAIITTNSFTQSDAGNIKIDANAINLTSDIDTNTTKFGGIISSITGYTGRAGNVDINAATINLAGGSQISVTTAGEGDGGNLNINTQNLDITGFSENAKSALLSNALISSGNGGNINLSASNIDVTNGGTISASNFSTRNPDFAPGTGAAGSIDIQTQTLNIKNSEPTTINASTFAKGGGNINIKADDRISVIGDEAAITASALGTSQGGEIVLSTPNLDLKYGGSVTTSAIDTGNAGNIGLNLNDLNLSRGKIIAESEISGGGEITISSENLYLNDNSLISTSVADSNGGGGNLTINNQDLILARNNSDIRANAVFGPGGNINITSPLLFLDFDSEIDASSKFGLDGNLDINSPESEKELVSKVLPQNVVDPVGLVTSACPLQSENSFAFVGNGGIKISPLANQGVDLAWQDTRINNTSTLESKKVSDLIEDRTTITQATRLVNNRSGEIKLVANQKLSASQFAPNNCF